MAEGRILLLILIISVPHVLMQSRSTDEITDQCPPNARVNLTGETLDQESELMVKSGYVFPKESIWTTEGNETFGCNCYSREICRPVYCPQGTNLYLKVDKDCKQDFLTKVDYYDYDYHDISYVSIYSREVMGQSVMLNSDNIQVESKYGICKWLNREMESVKFPKNSFLLRDDGAIYIKQKNISAMYNFDSFCRCSDVNFRNFEPICSDENKGISNGKNSGDLGCNKQSFNLYLNLLIVMGIKWFMEFSFSLL